jgi:hypothetical protein
MGRRRHDRSEENLDRLVRSAGEDVHPTQDFHRRTLARLVEEYRNILSERTQTIGNPRLVALLERYVQKTGSRFRFFRTPARYWGTAGIAAVVILGVFIFVPISTSTPPATFELGRARSALLGAGGSGGLRQVQVYLRQAALRTHLAGVLPEERIMNLEFLRFIIARVPHVDRRRDFLFLLDRVSARDREVHAARVPDALRVCLRTLGMQEAHGAEPPRPWENLLYGGRYKQAAELLAGDNRINARFLRAWALKEAGEYARSRGLFEQLASELTEGSMMRPILPMAMAAYSFLWEGDTAEGVRRLAALGSSDPNIFFQVGYIRLALQRDGDAAVAAWRGLPPGRLRSYALGNLAPRDSMRPELESAYYTERHVPGLGTCLVLVITGADLDRWTRVRINGSAMSTVHTGVDELLVPLSDKPALRLHLEICFPSGTLRRTLIPRGERE